MIFIGLSCIENGRNGVRFIFVFKFYCIWMERKIKNVKIYFCRLIRFFFEIFLEYLNIQVSFILINVIFDVVFNVIFKFLCYLFLDMKRKIEIKFYNRIYRRVGSLFGFMCCRVFDRQFLCIQYNLEFGFDMYCSRCE